MARKKTVKQSDGMYHVNGKKFEVLEGSRAQVWHGTAYKTSGGLVKKDLLQNKHGRIVSSKKHFTEKKNKRLEKAGYKPKKGKFVVMRKSMRDKSASSSSSKKKKNKTQKKGKSRGRR